MKRTTTFLLFFILLGLGFSRLSGRDPQEHLVFRDMMRQDLKLRDLHVSRLDTRSFEKPPVLRERLFLLINKDLFSELDNMGAGIGREIIPSYIQALFDEGIDVQPYIVDHKQFVFDNQWNPDAGMKLKDFIEALYSQSRRTHMLSAEQPDTEKTGLILLGKFPAAFLLWQQDRQGDPAWLATKVCIARNDFHAYAVNLSWSTILDVDHFEIAGQCWNDMNKRWEVIDINPAVAGDPNVITLDAKETSCRFPIPRNLRSGIKKFKFNFGIFYQPQAGKRDMWNESNEVQWNFNVNPCDFILADVNGFRTVMPAPHDYRGWFEAIPYLVVTEGPSTGVERNSHGYEIAPNDAGWANPDRKCSQTEMYYGRIDVSSITEKTVRGQVPNTMRKDKSVTNEEVSAIFQYLLRNILWRKTSSFRDEYRDIFFYRSTDFINPVNEKKLIKDLFWSKATGNLKILMRDAKYETANSRCGGCLTTSTKSIGGQAVHLQDIDPNCRPTLVLTYRMGTYNLVNSDEPDLERIIGGLQLSKVKIKFMSPNGAVLLFSGKKYSGLPYLLTAQDNIYDKNKPGQYEIPASRLLESVFLPKSVKFLDCHYPPPPWDTRAGLLSALRERKYRLLDLGVHGNISGFKVSDWYSNIRTGLELLLESISQTDLNSSYFVTTDDIKNLGGHIKFLINHNCSNGQFMHPDNISTAFLFRNQMLAAWTWSGAGTEDHYILHRDLSRGKRFGQAVLANMDEVMKQRTDANPWRSYFTAVLGDPTLRVIYDLPDLTVPRIEPPAGDQSTSRYSPLTVYLKNEGTQSIPKNSDIRCTWRLTTRAGIEVRQGAFNFKRGLEPGQEIIEQLTFDQPLLPGEHVFQVDLDYGNRLEEFNENNNDGRAEWDIKKKVFPEQVAQPRAKKIFTWGLKGGLSWTKTEFPIFVGGEENINFDEEIPVGTDYKTPWKRTYSGGISLEAGMGHSMSFESGFYYRPLLSTSTHPDRPDDYDKTSFQTLAVPLILKLNFGHGKKIFIGGGVEGAFVLSVSNRHHSIWNGGATDTTVTEIGGKMIADLLNTRLIGLVMVKAGLRLGPLVLEAGFSQGINDLFLDLSSQGGGKVRIGKFTGLTIQTGLIF